MTRDIFAELRDGFDALAAERTGKRVPRKHLSRIPNFSDSTHPRSRARPTSPGRSRRMTRRG